jgi:hypothetical protein
VEQPNQIVVTDQDGWSKTVPLVKPLLYVGSHENSDVRIEPSRGPGIAPRHLQLIAVPGSQASYRVANLSAAPVVVSSLPAPLSPRAVCVIRDGDSIQLAALTLVLRTGTGAPTHATPVAHPAEAQRPPAQAGSGTAQDIGLSLSLPQRDLAPDRPIEGMVTVRNLGDRPGVQFRIEVSGLPSDCYELEPSPVLFPGAERGIALRLLHPKGPQPVAGPHTLSVRATAPDAYPGQSAQVSQPFRLLPYHSHELRFIGARSGAAGRR